MWLVILMVLFAVALTYWYLQDDKLHTLRDKRVLVTGSSEGIGEQIAYHYARLGANVMVTARRQDRLNKVVEECKSVSPSAVQIHFAIAADMSKLEDTKRVIKEAIQRLGGLDILVLNHGQIPISKIYGPSEDVLNEFNLLMDVNFRSYVHLTTHALPQILANEGSIIVVSSLAGRLSQVLFSEYSASKFALNGFFHSLRNQFIGLRQNVSVTSCTLGLIATDSALKNFKTKYGQKLLQKIRPIAPKDAALDIVIGGAKRVAEVYSPYWNTWITTACHALWPAPLEYLSRYLVITDQMVRSSSNDHQ